MIPHTVEVGRSLAATAPPLRSSPFWSGAVDFMDSYFRRGNWDYGAKWVHIRYVCGICGVESDPLRIQIAQTNWHADLCQRRNAVRAMHDELEKAKLLCLGLMLKREPCFSLRALCVVVRRGLTTLTVHTLEGEDGPMLPRPWLYRLCLPSLAIANPTDPSIANEHMQRGYYYCLTQTLLALSTLQDVYWTLYLISATWPAALEAPECQWALQTLRVVSAPNE